MRCFLKPMDSRDFYCSLPQFVTASLYRTTLSSRLGQQQGHGLQTEKSTKRICTASPSSWAKQYTAEWICFYSFCHGISEPVLFQTEEDFYYYIFPSIKLITVDDSKL